MIVVCQAAVQCKSLCLCHYTSSSMEHLCPSQTCTVASLPLWDCDGPRGSKSSKLCHLVILCSLQYCLPPLKLTLLNSLLTLLPHLLSTLPANMRQLRCLQDTQVQRFACIHLTF